VELYCQDEEFAMNDANEELLGQSKFMDECVPDSLYNPTLMEEDVLYPSELSWKYENLLVNGIEEDIYLYEGPVRVCVAMFLTNSALHCKHVGLLVVSPLTSSSK
jgi:hypothetical protein